MKYLLDTMVLSEARKRNPDEAVASIWGRTAGEAARQGRIVPIVDRLLAATARRHALTLVTRNVTDVEGLGVGDPSVGGVMPDGRFTYPCGCP